MGVVGVVGYYVEYRYAVPFHIDIEDSVSATVTKIPDLNRISIIEDSFGEKVDSFCLNLPRT